VRVCVRVRDLTTPDNLTSRARTVQMIGAMGGMLVAICEISAIGEFVRQRPLGLRMGGTRPSHTNHYQPDHQAADQSNDNLRNQQERNHGRRWQ
jgi:hypothetical protein